MDGKLDKVTKKLTGINVLPTQDNDAARTIKLIAQSCQEALREFSITHQDTNLAAPALQTQN